MIRNRDGFRPADQVFMGNTSNPTTVGKTIEKLRHLFGLSVLVDIRLDAYPRAYTRWREGDCPHFRSPQLFLCLAA